MFLAALVLCAQIRHNDTLDESTALNDCSYALRLLLSQNISFLANKMNLSCLIRAEICSNENLSMMRQYHSEMFLIFEGYANSLLRDLPLTITIEQMAEILFEAGLIESAANVNIVNKILKATREGMIKGRAVFYDPDDPQAGTRFPEDEFTFSEFFEGVQRAGIIYYSNDSNSHEDENGDVQHMSMIDSMLQGLEDVVVARAKKIERNKSPNKYSKK
jgi:hypothetical protein